MAQKHYTPEQREKQRQRVRDHYQANKAYYSEKARRWDAEYERTIRLYLSAYLAEHPCVDCGNTDQRVLEFDHVRGDKLFNIAEVSRRKIALPKVIAEIAKCEVRCANCHRIVTGERGGWHNASLSPLATNQWKG